MYHPVVKNFSPKNETEYTIFLETGETMEIKFSKNNSVDNKEQYIGFYRHECFDKNKKRFIFYISECYCENDPLLAFIACEKRNLNVNKIFCYSTGFEYWFD